MRIWVKIGGVVALVCVLSWLVLSRDVLHPSNEDMSIQYKREIQDNKPDNSVAMKITSYWESANFSAKLIPESVFLLKHSVEITHKSEKIMNLNIFVRQALPPKDVVPSNQSIMFLHGMHYQSKNWEDLETLQIMAALGHRAIAIDLPGYGKSIGGKLTTDHVTFLSSTIKVLSLQEPVVVSPSMSGQFAMPFLTSHPESMSGFLPIAPVATSSIPKSVLQKIQVPTLHVFGGNDPTGLAQQARTSLSALPNSREIEVEGAGHSPYLEQPNLFHQILYNFLELIRFQPRPTAVGITWRNWKTWQRQSLLSRMK